MILILSENGDQSTNDVISWLAYKGTKFIRINQTSKLIIEKIEISFNELPVIILKDNSQQFQINFNEISAFWYRRGFLNIDFNSFIKNVKIELKNNIFNYLNNEWTALKEYLINVLEQKQYLGNYTSRTPNKLMYLSMAKNCGIDIPSTLITSRNKELNNYLDTKNGVISKSIQDIITFFNQHKYFCVYTEELFKDKAEALPDYFFPSLIQEKLSKQYEIRIFFIQNDFYPMAIFSQKYKGTEVDFRNSNENMPLRMVPYMIPQLLKEKLENLIGKLNLNTGSIDMVYTLDNRYVFLEINPVGQFGFVSSNCNYYLEEKIANFLVVK